jgi:hypothetical protein
MGPERSKRQNGSLKLLERSQQLPNRRLRLLLVRWTSSETRHLQKAEVPSTFKSSVSLAQSQLAFFEEQPSLCCKSQFPAGAADPCHPHLARKSAPPYRTSRLVSAAAVLGLITGKNTSKAVIPMKLESTSDTLSMAMSFNALHLGLRLNERDRVRRHPGVST